MLNLLRNCQTFPKQLHHLTMPSAEYEGVNFSPTLLTLLMVFSTTVILVGVEWCLTVVMSCISLRILSIFSCVYLPLVSLLWRKYLFRPIKKHFFFWLWVLYILGVQIQKLKIFFFLFNPMGCPFPLFFLIKSKNLFIKWSFPID